MGNIIDYVIEYGDLSFSEKELCTEDILTLAQLSYLKFDGLVPTIAEGAEGISVGEMDKVMDPEVVFADKRYEKLNRMLWQAVAKSRRFRSMTCNYCRSRLDEEKYLQFAAVVFFPEGTCPVITFRGTDENIVGWREDFYMAFKEPIPAQEESVIYLNQISCNVEEDFVICGHSKGGNLAVYSAMLADQFIQNKIVDVYSFDGPGFRPERVCGKAYENIRGRVHRIVPAYSLVGMLLENYENYNVIKSSAIGLFQHDCYTWVIEDGRLVYLSDIDEKQKKRNEVLNRFIFSMTEEEIRLFVDTFFDVIRKTGAATVMDFAENWKQNLKICLKQIRKLDNMTAERIRQILRLLFEIAADT